MDVDATAATTAMTNRHLVWNLRMGRLSPL
jgi:hypothetical protein